MLNEIRKQGALAAAQGLGLLECPYFRLDQLPAHSKVPVHTWRVKVEAWEAGWREFQSTRRNPNDTRH